MEPSDEDPIGWFLELFVWEVRRRDAQVYLAATNHRIESGMEKNSISWLPQPTQSSSQWNLMEAVKQKNVFPVVVAAAVSTPMITNSFSSREEITKYC